MDLMICSAEQVNKMSEEEIEDGVRDHINWIQSAVYDMTAYDEDLNHTGYGVEHDCAADDAYDDPEILRSLIGDHLPLEKGSRGTRLMFQYFRKHGHKAIITAVDKMAEYWC